MDLKKSIGLTIRDLRFKNKMTLDDVASKAGITWRYLTDVEYGRRSVSIDILSQIADVFHVKLSKIISLAEKMIIE